MIDRKEYMKQWKLNNIEKVKAYNKYVSQDYSQGKIYRLVCNTTGNTYYGSTKEKYLSRRLSRHVNDFRVIEKGLGHYKSSSYDIIKGENYQMILVENYPCESKYELESRERYYIENNECVNLVKPAKTQKK